MDRTLYTKGLSREGMLRAVEEAIKAGIPEIHVGYEYCAVCGKALGKVHDTKILKCEAKMKTVVHLHLCDGCGRMLKKEGKV